jgi:hypothetical protein
MNTLKLSYCPTINPISLNCGQVLETGEEFYLISTSDFVFPCSLAASCPVKPQVGDEVLCCTNQENSFVLSILKRANADSEAMLNFPDKAQVNASCLTFNADNIKSHSLNTEINTQDFLVKGHNLSFSFKLIHLVSDLVTSVFRSFFNRSRNMCLKVDSTATIVTNRLVVTSEEDLSLKAGGLDLKAKDSVVIDGRSLRLG